MAHRLRRRLGAALLPCPRLLEGQMQRPGSQNGAARRGGLLECPVERHRAPPTVGACSIHAAGCSPSGCVPVAVPRQGTKT
eukprot:286757-Chlamydomonas_euryale.AAC.2